MARPRAYRHNVRRNGGGGHRMPKDGTTPQRRQSTAAWVDFEVGDRSERTFSRLYERLPKALRRCSDGYWVHLWFPQDRHIVGNGGAVNRSEGLHSAFRTQLNRLGCHEGLHQKPGDAGVFAGTGVLVSGA